MKHLSKQCRLIVCSKLQLNIEIRVKRVRNKLERGDYVHKNKLTPRSARLTHSVRKTKIGRNVGYEKSVVFSSAKNSI